MFYASFGFPARKRNPLKAARSEPRPNQAPRKFRVHHSLLAKSWHLLTLLLTYDVVPIGLQVIGIVFSANLTANLVRLDTRRSRGRGWLRGAALTRRLTYTLAFVFSTTAHKDVLATIVLSKRFVQGNISPAAPRPRRWRRSYSCALA